MESFYDREAGVAWGPITKEEILDDIFLYGNRVVKRRNSIPCDPTFEKRELRSLNENHVGLSNTLAFKMESLVIKPDVQNRLPTPANIDEYMFEETLSDDDDNPSKSDIETSEARNDYSSIDSENLLNINNYQIIKEEPLEESGDISRSSEPTAVQWNNTPEHFSDNDEDIFNDTVAEMEKLLNEGLNYSMQMDKNITEEKSLSDNESNNQYNINNRIQSPPRTPQFNFPSIKIKPSYATKSSDQGATIKTLSNAKTITKIPVAPTFTQSNIQKKPFPKSVLTPINHCKQPHISVPTSSSKRRYKDIESPISVYIKNAGVTPLYKKITPSKPISSNEYRIDKDTKMNKENSLVLPDVIYKPAKRAIITKSDDIKLPNNIESLIPQKSKITRHEGRIGDCLHDRSLIRKKLADADSTNDLNITLDTTENISIHYTKRTYIK